MSHLFPYPSLLLYLSPYFHLSLSLFLPFLSLSLSVTLSLSLTLPLFLFYSTSISTSFCLHLRLCLIFAFLFLPFLFFIAHLSHLFFRRLHISYCVWGSLMIKILDQILALIHMDRYILYLQKVFL